MPRGEASDLSQPGGQEDQDKATVSPSQSVVGTNRLPVLAPDTNHAVTDFRSTGLIIRLPHGETRGADPRKVPADELRNAGHVRRPLSAVIRDKCIDCSGGSRSEADRCTAVKCALWPYRRRTNPFSARRGNSRSFKSETLGPVPPPFPNPLRPSSATSSLRSAT